MQFIPGGDLLRLIDEQAEGVLVWIASNCKSYPLKIFFLTFIQDEKYARFYVAEIVEALNELHKAGYAHGDVVCLTNTKYLLDLDIS